MPIPLDLHKLLVDTARDYAIFALDAQGTALLKKPFDDRELLRAVYAILAAPGSVFSI
jgi:DNA-binding response OmpR family regulator